MRLTVLLICCIVYVKAVPVVNDEKGETTTSEGPKDVSDPPKDIGQKTGDEDSEKSDGSSSKGAEDSSPSPSVEKGASADDGEGKGEKDNKVEETTNSENMVSTSAVEETLGSSDEQGKDQHSENGNEEDDQQENSFVAKRDEIDNATEAGTPELSVLLIQREHEVGEDQEHGNNETIADGGTAKAVEFGEKENNTVIVDPVTESGGNPEKAEDHEATTPDEIDMKEGDSGKAEVSEPSNHGESATTPEQHKEGNDLLNTVTEAAPQDSSFVVKAD